eukprot:381458-Amphidinium_carterae.1
MIQIALTWFAKKERIYLPQELFLDTVDRLCTALGQEKIHDGSVVLASVSSLARSKSRAQESSQASQVVILADKSEVESTSIAFILASLLNPLLLQE